MPLCISTKCWYISRQQDWTEFNAINCFIFTSDVFREIAHCRQGGKKRTQGRKHIVQLSYPHSCFSGVTLTVGEWPLPPNRLKRPSISAKEQYFSCLGYSVSINESLEQLLTLQLTYNILRILICYHLTSI